MKMAKSLIDYTKEIDRINEWLFNNRGDQISDLESYVMFFKEEILDGKTPSGLEKKLIDEAFRKYAEQHNIVKVKDEQVFKKAGGKNLSRDRRTTAKKVTTNVQEFIRLGAARADLEGLDTGIFGKIKNKTVRIQSIDKITRRGKPLLVFKDRTGRFVKRK